MTAGTGAGSTPTRPGIPSDFTNVAKGRSSAEGWFGTDKGLGVVADFFTDTYVAYTRDPDTLRGKAQIYRRGKLLKTDRHGPGRAPQLRHQHRFRRQRRLGRHRQGAGLGDR